MLLHVVKQILKNYNFYLLKFKILEDLSQNVNFTIL